MPALATLRNAALKADAEEKRFRASFAEEVARLETNRRQAFRRYAFLKALVDADASATDAQASRQAQLAAAAGELDWDEIDAARRPVLDALEPLTDLVREARLLREAVCAENDADEAKPVAAATRSASAPKDAVDLLLALAAFEAWYEGLRGRPFVELFDRYIPETPLVDF